MSKYQDSLNKIIRSFCSYCDDDNGCQNCKIKRRCNATAKSWVNTLQELIDKETKYQALEEAFGIDFSTLYMAFKDGIYTKQYGHLFVEHFVLKCDKELHCRPTYCAEIRFALKDYKKTWALCREELEDD